MSSSTTGQTSAPSSQFKSILDAGLGHALSEYKKKTGKSLFDHPLAIELQRCDSVNAISAIFQGQADAFQQFRNGDQRLTKGINLVVDVLYKFSKTAGAAASTVRLRNPDHDDSKGILTSSCRRSPMQRRSLLGSVSCLLYVSSLPPFMDPS
jgi:hypothetical protein